MDRTEGSVARPVGMIGIDAADLDFIRANISSLPHLRRALETGITRQLHSTATNGKPKKKTDPAPVDPAVMYESLKNRIAALEEEEEVVEEEERRFGARILHAPSTVALPMSFLHATHRLFVRQPRRRRSTSADWRKTRYMSSTSSWCAHTAAHLRRQDSVLSTHSLQSSSAWSANIRRRSRNYLRTKTPVRS